MALFDMFKCMEQYGVSEPSPTAVPETPQPISGFQGMYDTLKMEPTYYHLNNYMTMPYASSHWESGSPMLRTMNDESFLPPLSDRVDPNKIFNSDINALRSLAADQAKILKVFEKKTLESLTDKNKFGVTEEDIESMQAITAARNAIVSINEKQINIKKHIADLKIKQQNASGMGSLGGSSNGETKTGATGFGTEVLDSIYAANAVPMETMAPQEYTTANVSDAANLLDSIIAPNANIQNERDGVQTFVVVGDNSNDVKFAQFDANDNMINNPVGIPNAKIKSVDIEAGTAIDEFDRSYKIKKLGDEIM